MELGLGVESLKGLILNFFWSHKKKDIASWIHTHTMVPYLRKSKFHKMKQRELYEALLREIGLWVLYHQFNPSWFRDKIESKISTAAEEQKKLVRWNTIKPQQYIWYAVLRHVKIGDQGRGYYIGKEKGQEQVQGQGQGQEKEKEKGQEKEKEKGQEKEKSPFEYQITDINLDMNFSITLTWSDKTKIENVPFAYDKTHNDWITFYPEKSLIFYLNMPLYLQQRK